MTGPDGAVLAAVTVAFQVWDAVGWLGQAFFTARVLIQWLVSERAGKSVVPLAYWWLSFAGAVALVTYQMHRKDPVFLAGAAVNLAIYVRNLHMLYRSPDHKPRKANPVLPVLAGLVALIAIGVIMWQAGEKVMRFDLPLPWFVLGFAGQAIWSGRFVLQWYVSERRGRSVLPPAFFWVSIVGAVMLLIYATYDRPDKGPDWVMIAAFALNPIPYVRNLMLIRKST